MIRVRVGVRVRVRVVLWIVWYVDAQTAARLIGGAETESGSVC